MKVFNQRIENVTTYFADEARTVEIGKIVEVKEKTLPFTAIWGTMVSNVATFEEAHDFIVRQTQIVRPS